MDVIQEEMENVNPEYFCKISVIPRQKNSIFFPNAYGNRDS